MSSPLFRLPGCIALLSGLCLTGAACASELNAQERLEAVRHELLQAAMQGATQVRATSWIDAEGALRESSSFRHGLQVRGVKVLAYQRNEAGEPRAQVQWQGSQDLLTPAPQAVSAGEAAKPAASASAQTPVACQPSGLRHVLNWRLDTSGRWSMDEAHLVRDAVHWLSLQWEDEAAAQRHWRLAERLAPTVAGQGTGSSYLRLLTATVPTAPTSWTAHLQVRELPTAAKRFTLSVARQSNWPRVRVSLRVTGGATPEPVYEASAELTLQGQWREWARPQLDATVQDQLDRWMSTWAGELGERLRCQPVPVQVTSVQGQRVHVDQGELAGLRVGEEFLLSDRRKVPQHVLEPGASEQLVLARVERVGPQRAELQVMAGPVEQVGVHWQAWPTQARPIQALPMQVGAAQAGTTPRP